MDAIASIYGGIAGNFHHNTRARIFGTIREGGKNEVTNDTSKSWTASNVTNDTLKLSNQYARGKAKRQAFPICKTVRLADL